jgi:acetolactate synthase small subunit
MEARGLLLIAQKIASSLMVESKLPGGEGLATQALGSQGTNPLLDLARSVLQDAEGGHREVAGSLEAAFAAMQEAERAQDAYVGGDALQEALTTLLAPGCTLTDEEPDLEEGDGLATPLLAPQRAGEPVQPDMVEAPIPMFSPDVLTPTTPEDTEEEPLLPVTPTVPAHERPSTGSRKQRQPTPAPFLSLWDTLEPAPGTEPEQQDTEEEASVGVPPNTLMVLVAAEKREHALLPAGEAAEILTAASAPFTPATLVVEEPASDTEKARASSPDAHLPSVPSSAGKQVEEQLVAALQYLAGVCDGARALDGQGFNKVDARFGRDLAVQSLRRKLSASQLRAAHKLLVKYQSQLQDAGLTLPSAEQLQQWLQHATERKPGGPGTITLEGHSLRVCFPTFNPERVRQIKALTARFGGRGFDGSTRSWVLSVTAAQAVLKAFPELLGAAEVEAALQAALAPVEELPALDALLEQVRRCYHLVHGYAPNEQAMHQHIQTPAEAERWLLQLHRRLTDQGPTTLA